MFLNIIMNIAYSTEHQLIIRTFKNEMTIEVCILAYVFTKVKKIWYLYVHLYNHPY